MGSQAHRLIHGPAGRTSKTWLLKKVLATMIAIGALSLLTVGGTYAVLSTQDANKGSTIATGTLTFSNTVNAGTACTSYGSGSSGNVNAACTALITSSTLAYPGVPVTEKVTIANNGSLDASDLSVFMPSCTASATTGAPTPGGGNPCAASGDQLYIQETNSSGTATACWYPTTGTTCAFSASTLYVFSANYNSSPSALDLGAGPTHSQTRYFVIGLQVPSTDTGSLQGESATFPLTWHMTS